MSEQDLVTLLVKLGVVASLASILARSSGVKRMLLREMRTAVQRVRLALWFALVFGAGVATRAATGGYKAVDLGLEGCLLAGILGGYFTGLLAGVLVSLPAMIAGEYVTMPLLAGVGVMGGLVRDVASNLEDIWSFSPIVSRGPRRRTLYHLFFLASILFAEFLRQTAGSLFPNSKVVFYLRPEEPSWPATLAIYATTLFAVVLPLKIWNNARNESKLVEQERLLIEARLAALASQINPHFLFNTLNSVSALIRTDPKQAREVIGKLSSILRRLLRRTENLSPLRDEIAFIDDYLSIEVVRFGDKLRFHKEVDPETLDLPLPSMLLQPLVENCIRHGLASKVEGGTITLRTSRAGGRLHVAVEDDGVGIPEGKMASLLEAGIGVSNVNERLKVLFGGDYRMAIDSRPGAGTRVAVEIPEMQPVAEAAAAVR
ncbi:MAG: sensor histidine kinase [Bryobacteraceae bacterium]